MTTLDSWEKFLEVGYSDLDLSSEEGRRRLAEGIAQAVPAMSPEIRGTLAYFREGCEDAQKGLTLIKAALEVLRDEADK